MYLWVVEAQRIYTSVSPKSVSVATSFGVWEKQLSVAFVSKGFKFCAILVVGCVVFRA